MNKLITAFVAMTLSIISVFAQSNILAPRNDRYIIKGNTICVEKVTDFTTTKEEAAKALRYYFTTALNDSDKTMKLSDDDQFVVKIVTPVLALHSMVWETRGELTIQVRLKENRMKTVVTCGEIINKSSARTLRCSPVELPPINPEATVFNTNIPKKAAVETVNNLIDYMNTILSNISGALNVQSSEDDNW